jgi:hypothetical protein
MAVPFTFSMYNTYIQGRLLCIIRPQDNKAWRNSIPRPKAPILLIVGGDDIQLRRHRSHTCQPQPTAYPTKSYKYWFTDICNCKHIYIYIYISILT